MVVLVVSAPLAVLAANAAPASAAPGDVSVAPTALDFGTVFVGDSSTENVVITNTSGAMFTPTYAGGAAPNPAFDSVTDCVGVALAPGGTCNFSYTFHPSAPGVVTTSTDIQVDGQDYHVTLTGTGAANPIEVSPTTLAFGDVAVGTASSLAVVVTNQSTTARAPAFTDTAPIPAAQFSVSDDCQGRTLAPGASCQFTYTLRPTEPGLFQGGAEIRVDDASYGITLTGTGVGPSIWRVTPTTIDFGHVTVGDTETRMVTITNTSSLARTPQFSGGAPFPPVAYNGVQNCAGTTLAPGASCQFIFTFEPAAPGVFDASTTIGISDHTVGIDDESFDITLTGVGVTAPPTCGHPGHPAHPGHPGCTCHGPHGRPSRHAPERPGHRPVLTRWWWTAPRF